MKILIWMLVTGSVSGTANFIVDHTGLHAYSWPIAYFVGVGAGMWLQAIVMDFLGTKGLL